jgi:hypothetical protein
MFSTSDSANIKLDKSIGGKVSCFETLLQVSSQSPIRILYSSSTEASSMVFKNFTSFIKLKNRKKYEMRRHPKAFYGREVENPREDKGPVKPHLTVTCKAL